MAPPTVPVAPGRSSTAAHRDHLVAFYSDVEAHAASVAAHLAQPLTQGGAALVLATPELREAFLRTLARLGIDAATHARYEADDAAAALAAVMDGSDPDPRRFRAAIGMRVERAVAAGGPVHVYGELVAVLCAAGNHAGAVALEDLWNDLAEQVPFALCCGYPIQVFGPAVDAFRAVCDAHDRVLPSAALTAVTDARERVRAVGLLEQELAAGRSERDGLRRRQGRLEQELEGLAEVDRGRRRFAAMAAHDIRTPATVVGGILRLLQHDWEQLDPGQVREYLDVAARSVDQIDRLVTDLMLLGRLEEGALDFDLGPIALEMVVARVVHELAAATGRDVVLAVDAPVPLARADERRQVQILSNLVENALRYSEAPTQVVVRLARRDGALEVRVKDQGSGIRADDLPHLFRPFWRAGAGDGDGGTGLGLAITKALVEGQGGAIAVDSTPGSGTTVAYTVPVA